MNQNSHRMVYVAVGFALLLLFLDAANAQGWYNSSWAYRRPITINNTGSSLTDYQVRVALDGMFAWSNARSDGADVRFTASDGTTAIPFWIEGWSSPTSANIWVKIPSIAGTPTTTTIYFYYGNPGGTSVSSGSSTFRLFDDFESWTTPSTGWQDKASLPTAIADLTTAVYNSKLYSFGGYGNGPGNPLNKNYEFDPATNAWTEKTPMPTARWGMAAVEFDGLIYVFGGSISSGAGNVSKNEAYDPVLNSWTTKADIPTNLARQGVMGVRFGTKIHLFYESYHYEYDPLTDAYTQKANVPNPRFWCTSAVVGSKIYLIGGHHGGVGTNDNQEYDPATDSWTTKAPLPISLWGATRDNPVINGKIYVTHGLDGSAFHTSNYVYDPVTNTWELKGPATHPRDGVGCGVINNKLYVVGGRADFGGPYGLVYHEVYDPSLDMWTPEPGPSLWTTSGTSYVFADASAKYQGNYGLVVRQEADVATQRYAQSIEGFGSVYALDFNWQITDVGGIGVQPKPQGLITLTETDVTGSFFFYNGNGVPVVRWFNGSGFSHLQNSTWNNWHKVTVVRNGANSRVFFDENQYQSPTITSPPSTGTGKIKFGVYYATRQYLDNVRVRKWVTPEPVSSVGPEEVASGMPETMTCSSTGTGYSFPLSKVMMSFSVLSPGGDVTVRRYLETPPYPTYPNPPSGSTYIPVWFDITSTMANNAFSGTITVDVTDLTGFGAGSRVMCYNATSGRWVLLSGTYNSGAHTFTFSTTHFTAFGFINGLSTAYDVYLSSSQTSATAGIVYPNDTWGGGYLPLTNDWGYTGTQPFSLYIVPQNGTTLGACELVVQYDSAVVVLDSVLFTGSVFSGPNLLFATANRLGSTNSVTLNASLISPTNVTTQPGDYIARLHFQVLRPGHSSIASIGEHFAAFNEGTSPSNVYVIPHQAEVKAYLGDVASSGSEVTGDGKINYQDLSPWSTSYWSGVPPVGMTNYKSKYDIGPTQNGYVFSLPTHDQKIDFEDLVIFAITYGQSARNELPKVPVQSNEPLVVSLGRPEKVGDELRVPVLIGGGVTDVRAMKLELNGQFGSFLGVNKGELLRTYETPVMLMSRADGRRVYVDLAVMGLEAQSVNREGEVVVLRFAGTTSVSLVSAECRSSWNTTLGANLSRSTVGTLPTKYNLGQNYPNPFNPTTTIEYQLPQGGQVKLEVFNILGERVATLVNNVEEAGFYHVQWNGQDESGRSVASGMYMYRLVAGEFVSVKRMVLLK